MICLMKVFVASLLFNYSWKNGVKHYVLPPNARRHIEKERLRWRELWTHSSVIAKSTAETDKCWIKRGLSSFSLSFLPQSRSDASPNTSQHHWRKRASCWPNPLDPAPVWLWRWSSNVGRWWRCAKAMLPWQNSCYVPLSFIIPTQTHTSKDYKTHKYRNWDQIRPRNFDGEWGRKWEPNGVKNVEKRLDNNENNDQWCIIAEGIWI